MWIKERAHRLSTIQWLNLHSTIVSLQKVYGCFLALQQCVNESPEGSHIKDSSPHDAVVCSKWEKLANMWHFIKSPQLKNLLCPSFFLHSYCIYRCRLGFICSTTSHYFGLTLRLGRWMERTFWKPQRRCAALQNCPHQVCGWLCHALKKKGKNIRQMHFQTASSINRVREREREKVQTTQTAKVPLIKVVYKSQ